VGALGPSTSLAGSNALSNALAFLLSDPSEESREKLPYWTARIEPWLLVAHYPDRSRPELSKISSHGPDTLSTQAIKRPDKQHVEFAPMSTGEKLGESTAVITGAARRLAIQTDEIESEALRPISELAFLILRCLVPGAYPEVERHPTRRFESRHRQPI